MSQRVTKIRKKTATGFGDPIPIGAQAENVTLQNGSVLQDVIGQLQDGHVKHAKMTQAQYDALSNQKKNDGTVYFITDGGGSSSGDDTSHMELTSAEYAALSTAVQNNGTIYFITDGEDDDSGDDTSHMELTSAEYSALSTAVQNNGTVYFIADGTDIDPIHAAAIGYNPSLSALTSTNVQTVIDELKNSYIDPLMNLKNTIIGASSTDITVTNKVTANGLRYRKWGQVVDVSGWLQLPNNLNSADVLVSAGLPGDTVEHIIVGYAQNTNTMVAFTLRPNGTFEFYKGTYNNNDYINFAFVYITSN